MSPVNSIRIRHSIFIVIAAALPAAFAPTSAWSQVSAQALPAIEAPVESAPSSDSIAPSRNGFAMESASPAPNSQMVPRNVGISIRMTSEIDPSSVTDESLTVGGVSGDVVCRGATLTFRPQRPLVAGSTVTATLQGTLRDRHGHRLGQDIRWTFRVGTQSIAGSTMQIPVQPAKALLFRYPYLQSNSPRNIKILWGTSRSGVGEVQYQRSGEAQWMIAKSTERKYAASRTRLALDFYQHEVVLDDLPANAEFQYRILLDGVTLAQGIPFKTLPAIGNNSVGFIALADFGTPYSTPRQVRDAIVKGANNNQWRYPHDFIVGVGDIAYYNGSYAEFDVNFFGQVSGKNDMGDGSHSLVTRRPFVPVLGNHEYTSDNEKSVPEGFLESFSNPIPPNIRQDQRERYYSFDSGDAHFVVLDSMKFQGNQAGVRGDMINWLEHDLAATHQKWRIVFSHHGPFAHGPHGTWGDAATNQRLRTELVPVLQKHGVQLVISGHNHLYERTVRTRIDHSSHIVREGGCRIVEAPDGIVFLTVGNGGDDLHGRSTENSPCGTDGFNQAMREYGEGYDFDAMRNGRVVLIDANNDDPQVPAIRYGFTLFNVSTQRVAVKAYNYEGAVLDEFEIR
jgi:hypothetical protein